MGCHQMEADPGSLSRDPPGETVVGSEAVVIPFSG